MDIRMAAKDDVSEAKSVEEQRVADIAVQTVYNGAGYQGSWSTGKSELELENESKSIWQRCQ